MIKGIQYFQTKNVIFDTHTFSSFDDQMPATDTDPEDILRFWFDGPTDDADHATARIDVWFGVDEAFDLVVRERFSSVVDDAGFGRFDHWQVNPRGTLALIISLDQFPRNIHRRSARAFATDSQALATAKAGVARGFDRQLTFIERMFFYIPFEHAEDLECQDRFVRYSQELSETAHPDYRDIGATLVKESRAHRDVIARFGRFPHRNVPLQREPTRDESQWLEENTSGWGQGAND